MRLVCFGVNSFLQFELHQGNVWPHTSNPKSANFLTGTRPALEWAEGKSDEKAAARALVSDLRNLPHPRGTRGKLPGVRVAGCLRIGEA